MNLIKALQEIDEIFSQRWRSLTCNEVKTFYDDFWFGLKELNGNSEGFTGLSEFVVFRFVVSMLGGAQPRSVNKELSAFQCGHDGRCWITHAVNVGADQALKPDVGIWWKTPSYAYWEQHGELWAAVEIKAGLDGGALPINQIQDRFQRIRAQHPNARCLLLSHRAPGGPVQSALSGFPFEFLSLENNQKLLWRELFEKLGMSSAPFWSLIRGYP